MDRYNNFKQRQFSKLRLNFGNFIIFFRLLISKNMSFKNSCMITKVLKLKARATNHRRKNKTHKICKLEMIPHLGRTFNFQNVLILIVYQTHSWPSRHRHSGLSQRYWLQSRHKVVLMLNNGHL